MVEKLLERTARFFLIGLFFCVGVAQAVAEESASPDSEPAASNAESSEAAAPLSQTQSGSPRYIREEDLDTASVYQQELKGPSAAAAPMFRSQSSFERRSLFETPSNQLANRLTREKVYAYSDQSSDSLFEYIAKRTRIGYGYEFLYDSNVNLEDNRRQDDYKSTLESVVLFADPRGPLLYGFQYEVNAFRFMRRNANAVNHDLVTFADFDPGGPIQYRMGYTIITNHSFVFGDDEIDVLRRNAKLEQTTRQEFNGRLRYEYNRSNKFIFNSIYTKFNDHAVNDADSDRDTWQSTLDWERDLVPTWFLLTGASYEEVEVPGNRVKDSNQHGGRLGVRHELTRYETLAATFSFDRNKATAQKRSNDPNFRFEWFRELTPRTKVLVSYLDERTTSFSTGRTRFRSRSPAVHLLYQLTPRLDLVFDGSYTWQRSRSSDLAAGSTERRKQTLYSVKPGLAFQVQEQLRVLLNYTYRRSRTRDYSDHQIYFNFEGSF
jgi:hypothetical protein